MTERLLNFIRGMGSIFDIVPRAERRYDAFINNSDGEEIRIIWATVGEDIWSGIGTVDKEVEQRNLAISTTGIKR